MRAGTAHNGEVALAYQADGPADGHPLLLIAGTGMPLVYWPADFCAALIARGFTIARLDNRDTGASTHLSAASVPTLTTMLLRPAAAAPYRLDDMADDAAAVLDTLGWPTTHLAGHSLGAMIAQTMAIRHPTRIRTLTSISATPSPRIGRASPRTTLRLIRARRSAPRTDTVQALATRLLAAARIYASPGYPLDTTWYDELAHLIHQRGGLDPDGARRHNAAILASGDRRPALAHVAAPTLVLHGQADPLVTIDGARATATAIPHATLTIFPGMGHDLPRPLWPAITTAIRALADTTHE
jgi:pimeloyl-ACP methyl ester carboxylesterase